MSIALIEEGGFYEQENGNQTLVPGYYSDNLAGANINWNFQTEVQPQLLDQSFSCARGKTLGGSSALNAMLYQRGTNGSYQAWADAVGDQSWTFDNFLPFFQKSANYTPPNTILRAENASVLAPSSIAYSATGGPLHVSFPNTAASFSSWGQLGLRELGLPDIEDFSSGALIGSQYCPLTVRPDDQTRSTSEASYLQASFARNELYPNLVVYIHSLGSKIIFDSNKTATGVLVKSNNISYLLNAMKEVIVSAGVFQSPQLLMVSGVGPSQELAKHNITVVADRPGVGQNMWDHVLWPVTYETDLQTTASLDNPAQAYASERQYHINKTGLLTTNGADYLGWEKLPQQYFNNLSSQAQADLSAFPSDWPDLEFVILGFTPTSYLPKNVNYATCLAALITPVSRGNISLNSSSMDDPPVINVGWLTNNTDAEVAVAAIKRARDFFKTKAVQGALIGEEVLPGKNVTTDAEILEWARYRVETVYHASCTCKCSGKMW